MKEIQLVYRKGNPKFVHDHKILIDDDDYERVMQYNWWYCWSVRKNDRAYYAHTRIGGKMIELHRFIMNAEKGQMVDHKDGNGLNNQKSNLRFCTNAQNQMNKIATGKSKYLGVCWHTTKSKKYRKKTNDYAIYTSSGWKASIAINGITTHIGRFKTEIEAAKAYDSYAKIYNGEFARLNFPDNN